MLGPITIDQNLELNLVRSRINDLMKEKGLCVVGPADSTQALVSSLKSTSSGSSSKISPTSNISLPTTSFNSPAYVSTSSSVSSKFVSNDWCFVDCKSKAVWPFW